MQTNEQCVPFCKIKFIAKKIYHSITINLIAIQIRGHYGHVLCTRPGSFKRALFLTSFQSIQSRASAAKGGRYKKHDWHAWVGQSGSQDAPLGGDADGSYTNRR